MTETEKRMHRVCFTGHRPEKLTRSDRAIKKDLEKEIRQAIADGLIVFITGMARGVDIWAAQIVLTLFWEEEFQRDLFCTSKAAVLQCRFLCGQTTMKLTL
ncbi:MAG: SLOG family protein [Faecousia sp.]